MQALLLCDSVPALLHGVTGLRVHSVFQHACNLQTPAHELLTLQTCSMSLVPRGCVLPCNDLQPMFQQAECLSVHDGLHLAAPFGRISLAGASQCHLSFEDRPRLSDLNSLQSLLRCGLPDLRPAGGIYQMLHGGHDKRFTAAPASFKSAVADLERWLRGAGGAADICLTQTLQRIVGFGIGLTPSADDFLLGVLIIMDAMREPLRDRLVSALHPLLAATTDVSAAMLANACAGRYGTLFLRLLEVTGAEQSAVMEQIARHGHSSGHDTLCGMLFALECLCRNHEAVEVLCTT